MNKRRLLKLADLLEADASNRKGLRFDLGVVAEPSDRKSKAPAVDCGTTACAMGLAAVSKVFKRAGLGFKVGEFKDNDDESGWGATGHWYLKMTMHGTTCGYDDAAVALFDISETEADFLFNPGSYGDPTPRGAKGERIVARRIRKFVEKGGKPDGV